VNEVGLDIPMKILAVAAVVEIGTGIALLFDPAIVLALLLGVSGSWEGTSLGRFLGIALLTLGWACWPSRQRAESGSPALRARSIYNVLIATYLAYLGTFGHQGGLLLWPVMALHAVMALMLVWTALQGRSHRRGSMS
jgi:Ca2+/Na+ antiporter